MPGLGLRSAPNRIRLTAPGAPPAVIGWSAPEALPHIRLRHLDVGAGYLSAVALAGATKPCVQIDVEIDQWDGS